MSFLRLVLLFVYIYTPNTIIATETGLNDNACDSSTELAAYNLFRHEVVALACSSAPFLPHLLRQKNLNLKKMSQS